MDKKSFIEGMVVGAVVGGVAGAITAILLAPKSGKETRDAIKADLEEIRDKILAELGNAGEFTKKKYQEVLKAVIAEYEAAKKITAAEAREIEARLREGYEALKGRAHEHVCGDEAPATK